MRRGVVGLVLLLAAAAIAGVIWVASRPRAGAGAGATRRAGQPADAPSATERVRLLFPGSDGQLHVEARELPWPEGARERAQSVVAELLRGPKNQALQGLVPSEATLLGVSIEGDVAYVDLGLPGHAGLPSSGSRRELLVVYALVNSLVANVPGIERVAFLWNGTQQATFAGHVDTTHPLRPDRALLERQQ